MSYLEHGDPGTIPIVDAEISLVVAVQPEIESNSHSGW